MLQLNESNFEKEVLQEKLPVVVDFWADWCGPCKAIAPVFEELAKEFAGRIKFAKLDVEESPALASRYGIMSIPALVFFQQGKVVGQSIGVIGKADLKKKIEAVLR